MVWERSEDLFFYTKHHFLLHWSISKQQLLSRSQGGTAGRMKPSGRGRRERHLKLEAEEFLKGEVTDDSLKLSHCGPLRRRVRRGILAGLPLSRRITSHLKWLPGWQPLDRQFAIIPGPIPPHHHHLSLSPITRLLASVPHRPLAAWVTGT